MALDLSNWIDLQATRGESFASMADRLVAPEALAHLDERGRAGNAELAAALRKQRDDPAAVSRFAAPPGGTGQ